MLQSNLIKIINSVATVFTKDTRSKIFNKKGINTKLRAIAAMQNSDAA